MKVIIWHSVKNVDRIRGRSRSKSSIVEESVVKHFSKKWIIMFLMITFIFEVPIAAWMICFHRFGLQSSLFFWVTYLKKKSLNLTCILFLIRVFQIETSQGFQRSPWEFYNLVFYFNVNLKVYISFTEFHLLVSKIGMVP